MVIKIDPYLTLSESIETTLLKHPSESLAKAYVVEMNTDLLYRTVKSFGKSTYNHRTSCLELYGTTIKLVLNNSIPEDCFTFEEAVDV